MIVLPAIDLKDGKPVRLVRGDFSTAGQVAENAVDAAREFAAKGAGYLHMVDLDGAKSGDTVNRDLILEVAKHTPAKIELGGGIRSCDVIEDYLSHGIDRVILGSAAIKQPALVRQAVREYAGHITIGIDAKNGLVATEGWLSDSEVDYLTLASEMEHIGADCIIFTDISKDGTLSGPNFEQLAALNRRVSLRVIASGGIRDIGHIRRLRDMGLYGAICGKSLYQGTLSLGEALAAAHR